MPVEVTDRAGGYTQPSRHRIKAWNQAILLPRVRILSKRELHSRVVREHCSLVSGSGLSHLEVRSESRMKASLRELISKFLSASDAL